jgi:hypothetical protein
METPLLNLGGVGVAELVDADLDTPAAAQYFFHRLCAAS